MCRDLPCNNQGMVVRRVSMDDIGGAVAMLAAAGLPISAAVASARLAVSRVADSPLIALVACDADQVAGGVALEVLPNLLEQSSVGRVLIMAVHPSHQRLGVGRLLMDAVEEQAWALGCVRVEIVYGVNRADAKRFFTSIGYRALNNRLVKRKD